MTDLIFNYLYSVHEHLSDITNIRNKAKRRSCETRGRHKTYFNVNKLTEQFLVHCYFENQLYISCRMP